MRICKLQHKHPYFFCGFSYHISLCLCKLVISTHKLYKFTLDVSMFLFENASANKSLSQRGSSWLVIFLLCDWKWLLLFTSTLGILSCYAWISCSIIVVIIFKPFYIPELDLFILFPLSSNLVVSGVLLDY